MYMQIRIGLSIMFDTTHCGPKDLFSSCVVLCSVVGKMLESIVKEVIMALLDSSKMSAWIYEGEILLD